MVSFDTIVRVLDRVVQRFRRQLTDCFGQRRGPVGDHLTWVTVIADRAGEEPARGDGVASLRHVYVDDLAMLVDGAVGVTPHAGHLDVGFVDVPAAADVIAARVGRVDQDRSEALHPTEQRDVINADTPFGEEFFEITIRQPVAQVPAHREHDHLRWEPEPCERRQLDHARWNSTTSSHPARLADQPSSNNATEPF